MTEPRPASVINGTYNDASIIEPTFGELAVQSFADFALVLADDGTDQNHGPSLPKWAPRFPRGIKHVWQEKRGFRKARVFNGAVLAARFDPVLVMDMDCLPHRDF